MLQPWLRRNGQRKKWGRICNAVPAEHRPRLVLHHSFWLQFLCISKRVKSETWSVLTLWWCFTIQRGICSHLVLSQGLWTEILGTHTEFFQLCSELKKNYKMCLPSQRIGPFWVQASLDGKEKGSKACERGTPELAGGATPVGILRTGQVPTGESP